MVMAAGVPLTCKDLKKKVPGDADCDGSPWSSGTRDIPVALATFGDLSVQRENDRRVCSVSSFYISRFHKPTSAHLS